MSQKELARLLGIDDETVGRYERGETGKIPVEYIQRVCDIFGVDVNLLTQEPVTIGNQTNEEGVARCLIYRRERPPSLAEADLLRRALVVLRRVDLRYSGALRENIEAFHEAVIVSGPGETDKKEKTSGDK